MIDTRIRIITIIGAVGVLLIVLELVRRRKLKEEYSVLWVVTALVVLVLAIWYDLLTSITSLVGAAAPASAIFFFGLLFFLVLMLHFSVRISTLERRLTELIQDVGINGVGPGPELAEQTAQQRLEQESPL
jgi:hypothetical protein